MKNQNDPELKLIKALAELDEPNAKWEHILDPDGKTWVVGQRYSAHRGYIPAKNYLASYDAIIPLIQKQDGETKNLVEDYIEECQTMKTSFWYDATPSQLCEALLRATGKGKD